LFASEVATLNEMFNFCIFKENTYFSEIYCCIYHSHCILQARATHRHNQPLWLRHNMTDLSNIRGQFCDQPWTAYDAL